MSIYLARQPIFDRNRNVIAYELLHRSDEENYYKAEDGDQASSEVIANALLNIGLERLTRGRRAYINFTRQLLENNTALLLPKEQVMIEILEDIEFDEPLRAICSELRKAGYSLALDDYANCENNFSLLDLADVVKIDFQMIEPSRRAQFMSNFCHRQNKLLAEKVETLDEFSEAKTLGFDYFQGYFFCKPVMISTKSISANRLAVFRLMKEIHNPEMDFDLVEAVIKQDSTLAYKLLRCINSLVYATRLPIKSIRQALTLLGQKELIKWASLVCLHTAGDDKPDELMVTALSRARFCESLALKAGLKEQRAEFFLTGLFSLLDTFLDQPMADILEELPLVEGVKDALLDKPGEHKNVLDMALYYERGAFDRSFAVARREYALDEIAVTNCYLDSLALSDELMWS